MLDRKTMAFRIDKDVEKWLENQQNKSNAINTILRSHMKTEDRLPNKYKEHREIILSKEREKEAQSKKLEGEARKMRFINFELKELNKEFNDMESKDEQDWRIYEGYFC